MRILMVTMSMHIGGAETHILELCRALSRMGHEITLASNGGVYADLLEAEGVTQVRLPLHTKKPWAVVRSYRGLETLICTGRFDLVHAHARIPAWICGLLWDRYHFRFTTTAHLNFSLNPLWRVMSRWGERTMSVADDIVSYLVDNYGMARDRIHTTINGIDLEKFSPDVPYEETLASLGVTCKNRRRIVYMSRLDNDRAGYAVALARIAPRIAAAFPDTDILIVGGGGEEERIRRIAATSNRTAGRNIVTMTGARSDTNVFCACATIFIGVSRSVLEAMAASVPVIVAGNQGVLGIFDESKLQTAVDTNFCCRGCPQYDDDELYRDIAALLSESQETLRARGAWCRSVIARYYTAERMARDYIAMYERLLASPVPFSGHGDVVISGYYGFGNMGDESLLATIAEELTALSPGVRITALTRRPRRDSARHGIRCIGRTDVFRILREFRHAKLLISGGGSLLQDVTSRKSLLYYATVIRFAQRAGMRTMIYANGIGPIRMEKNRRLTAKTLSVCDVVSVRDPDSAAELMRLGVPESLITCTADPAFCIAPTHRTILQKRYDLTGLVFADDVDTDASSGNRYYLISLRALRWKDCTPSVIREISRLADWLWKQFALIPIFVPMQPQNDDTVCRQAMQETTAPARFLAPDTAADLIGLSAGAQFVVGMRLHSLIYAVAAGTPILGISYDPKIDAFCRIVHQTTCVSADHISQEALRTHAAQLCSANDVIRRTMRETAHIMRERCREDATAAIQLLQKGRID